MFSSRLVLTAIFLSSLTACAELSTQAGGARRPRTVSRISGPVVVCEMSGKHGNDPDRIPNDAALVLAAVQDTRAQLPPWLREVADQLTYVVNHGGMLVVKPGEEIPRDVVVSATKLFGGWSAEDDPDYHYPDREFAPRGTIKVNMSEVFVQLVHFCGSDLLRSAVERGGCRELVREIVAHETLHAYQYHTIPVQDLARIPGACPDGLCNPALIQETRRKIAYEREAWVFGSGFRSIVGMVALSRAAHRVSEERPDLMTPGSRYSLLPAVLPEPTTPQAAAAELAADDFTGGSKAFYEAQYLMPELAWEMHRLLTDVAAKAMTKAAGEERYKTLSHGWFYLLNDPDVVRSLLSAYPHLTAVAHRFEADSSAVLRLLRTPEK